MMHDDWQVNPTQLLHPNQNIFSSKQETSSAIRLHLPKNGSYLPLYPSVALRYAKAPHWIMLLLSILTVM